jgi:hypothetical protein
VLVPTGALFGDLDHVRLVSCAVDGVTSRACGGQNSLERARPSAYGAGGSQAVWLAISHACRWFFCASRPL